MNHSSAAPRNVLFIQLAYIIAMYGLAVVRGVFPTVPRLLVVLVLGFVWTRRMRNFLGAIFPLIALLICYTELRSIADNLSPYAIHISDLTQAERLLFAGHIPSVVLQQFVPPSTALGHLLWAIATAIYYSHFVTPILVAAVLWARDRRMYWFYIGGLLAISYAGFVFYVLIPAAPPWWASYFGQIPEHVIPPTDPGLMLLGPNPVAAFPSLHAAYALYIGWIAANIWPRISVIRIVLPAIVCWATLYLGHHYVVDHIGGWMLGTLVLCVVSRLSNVGSNAKPQLADAARQSDADRSLVGCAPLNDVVDA